MGVRSIRGRIPKSRLAVPFKFQYTDRMKNKKYLMVDRYNGTATFITLEEGETIEMITEGMEEQEGDVRSWDGEEHIIIELPA
jgi:hypothetical protein